MIFTMHLILCCIFYAYDIQIHTHITYISLLSYCTLIKIPERSIPSRHLFPCHSSRQGKSSFKQLCKTRGLPEKRVIKPFSEPLKSMEDLSLSSVGAGSSSFQTEQEDQDQTLMKKICAQVEKAASSFPGISSQDCAPIQQEAEGRTLWSEEGRETSGDILPPGNSLKRKFCFTLCYFFLLVLSSSGIALKTSQGLHGKSPLEMMLKTRSITQMRLIQGMAEDRDSWCSYSIIP